MLVITGLFFFFDGAIFMGFGICLSGIFIFCIAIVFLIQRDEGEEMAQTEREYNEAVVAHQETVRFEIEMQQVGPKSFCKKIEKIS